MRCCGASQSASGGHDESDDALAQRSVGAGNAGIRLHVNPRLDELLADARLRTGITHRPAQASNHVMSQRGCSTGDDAVRSRTMPTPAIENDDHDTDRMNTSLPLLVQEVRNCRICAADLPHGPRPVLQIDERARILIASQAPGRRVHANGIPFDDVSGDRLRAWMGIDRPTFYDLARVAILPMGFCYPGTGRSGDLPPRTECAPAWRARLLACLPNLRLTIAVGRFAQAWHLPDAPATLTETVRAWERHWPSVLPIPHPSPRNQFWLKHNPWFETDVLPVLRGRVAELLS